MADQECQDTGQKYLFAVFGINKSQIEQDIPCHTEDQSYDDRPDDRLFPVLYPCQNADQNKHERGKSFLEDCCFIILFMFCFDEERLSDAAGCDQQIVDKHM